MNIDNQNINQIEGNQIVNEDITHSNQIQRVVEFRSNMLSVNLNEEEQGINNANNANNANNVENNLNELHSGIKVKNYFTFTFLMFFILNTLCLIHSYIIEFDITNYSLCLWPILNKGQYYRILTNHFYYCGISDYLTNITALYFISIYLEREIGTIYTLIIGFHSIIIISLIYLIGMFIFKIVLRLSFYNFSSSCGFSSICFAYFIFYFLLSKNKKKSINLIFFPIKGIYFSFFLLVIFYVLTPNSSLIGHLGGIASAIMIYNIFTYFSVPQFEWVNDMEKALNINNNLILKNYLGYITTEENDKVKVNLKEISRFLNFDKCKEKLGIRVIRGINIWDSNINDESGNNDNDMVNSNDNNNNMQNIQREIENLPELAQRLENQEIN